MKMYIMAIINVILVSAVAINHVIRGLEGWWMLVLLLIPAALVVYYMDEED